MAVQIEKTAWGGWPNCYRISNGEIELMVTGDIGPRIMRFGFPGGQNFFKVFDDQLGKSGEPDWQLRGGHRIWLAPEDFKRTYARDNDPVEIEIQDGVLTATQLVEPETGLQKQLVIRMASRGAGVEILHRMRNTLPFAIRYSAWGLTMMAQGGTGVTGFPPRGRHEDVLAPTNPLVMWAFTDLSDPRWKFLKKYLVLHHDPANTNHTKLGHFNPKTWGAYFLGSEMFLKQYDADPSLTYPDMGCSYETFASDGMLELETLGPLTEVEPGGWLDHTERWSLHRVHLNEWSDDALDSAILPLLG
ncbi:MAG: hypothetical protein ABUS51_04835 [Acidobacteriota bacterium]